MTIPPEFATYEIVRPISPKEARAKHLVTIPEEVIAVINDFLIKGSPNSSTGISIDQNEVIEHVIILMKEHGKAVERNDFFDKHWLDFESLFKKAGWKIEYNKPGYNESYTAFWTFKG